MGRHHRRRRSQRLRGHDYSSPGYYMITIATRQRRHYFGSIKKGEVELTALGRVARNELKALKRKFLNIEIDDFVVMPNHIHVVIQIARRTPIHKAGIGKIVTFYKSKVNDWAREKEGIFQVWQINYHDHVVRDEASLKRIRKYIRDNPRNWRLDRFAADLNDPGSRYRDRGVLPDYLLPTIERD